MTRISFVVSGICVALLWSARPEVAHAGIGACGDIHVEANAMCEVVAPGVECEGMCTPISVRAACSAQLAAECRGGCDELPSVDCRGECTAGCEADCDVDPGKFDCQGSCEADCSGQCEASCEASDDQASCEASCQGSCSASCSGHCEAEPPSASCEAKCEASCEGSCEVETNLDCQIDCQADGYAECEAEVQGGCELECESEEGALFCDGEYIDHGDNLDMCIDALRAALDIEVEASSMGSAECANGSCMAEGSAEAKVSSDCTVASPGRATGAGSAGLFMLGLVGLFGARRRRPR